MTASILPSRIIAPAMLSAISVVGMPSFINSHAVRREPCRNGRVSSANTCNLLSRLDGRANHAQRRAVSRGRQRAGVAVRQHASAGGQQHRAVLAHGFIGGDVLHVHALRFGHQSRA